MSLSNPSREFNTDDRLDKIDFVKALVIDNDDRNQQSPDSTNSGGTTSDQSGGNTTASPTSNATQVRKIKIRIPDLHRNIADTDLPWAVPDINGQGAAAGIGTFPPIPEIGTWIYVSHQDDTGHFPMYHLGTTDSQFNLPEFTNPTGPTGPVNYPFVHGHVNASGSLKQTDTKADIDNEIHISGTNTHIDGHGHVKIQVADYSQNPNKNATSDIPAGRTIEIQGVYSISLTGNYTLNVGGNATIYTKGTANIYSQGDCNISSSANVNIKGTTINMGAGSAPVGPTMPTGPAPRMRPTIPSPANMTNL